MIGDVNISLAPSDNRLAVIRRRVGDVALLEGDEAAIAAALGQGYPWLTDTDRNIIDNWRRRVRRRIEDRIRKDRRALAACAAALGIE